MSKRAIGAVEALHLVRASELVDEAARHHHDATVAHRKGNDRALAEAHRNIGRCLRGAQQCFRDMAEAAGDGDSAAGSTEGRGSPLLHGDLPGWLARARVGALRDA